MKYIKTYNKLFESRRSEFHKIPDMKIGNVYLFEFDNRIKQEVVYLGYYDISEKNNYIIVLKNYEGFVKQDDKLTTHVWGNSNIYYDDINMTIEEYLKENTDMILPLIDFLKDKIRNFSGDKKHIKKELIENIINRIESDPELKKYINLNQLGII